jgi:signal transduction histidine kinase/ligand-binding sensor domain-containing protein
MGLMRLLSVGVFLIGIVLASRALAVDPDRSLAQLHHTSWTLEDGAPPDIWAIAQSTDGYLWLGTGAGLFRFDGVRFEKYKPLSADFIPSANVTALCATAGGDLWIGYATGVIARLHQNRLSAFQIGMANASIAQIVEGEDRIIWAVTNRSMTRGLAKFTGGRWSVLGSGSGVPPGGIFNVLSTRAGDLWALADDHVLVLHRGSQHFESMAEPVSRNSRLVQTPDGRLWLSDGATGKIRTLPGLDAVGTGPAAVSLQPQPAIASGISRLIADRDGGLWGSYRAGGIFRIARPLATSEPTRSPAAEKFTLREGLTSDLATPIIEDREGNIWVGTNLGLDRFRMTNAVLAPGLPVTERYGFFTARGEHNTLYVASGEDLFKVYADRPADLVGHIGAAASFLYTDAASRIWIGTRNGLAVLQHGHIEPVELPPYASGFMLSWAEDSTGKVCISIVDKGVSCRSGTTWQPSQQPLDASHAAPSQILFDSHNRLWLDYDNRLAMLDGTRLREFSRANGLNIGGIDIVFRGNDDILVGGEFGVARFDGQRFVTLSSDQTPELSRITGIVQSADGTTWLNGIAGLVRIARTDLIDAFKHPERPFPNMVLTMADGLPGVAQMDSDTPTLLENTDGHIWITTNHGVAWLDPKRLVRNTVPPPVVIRSLSANGIEYAYPERLMLKKGTSNIQIDYTALSLTIPARVHFRYRLDGVDQDWVESGTRRVAFYTQLGPGHYSFRVIASNNDGVWNNTGATVLFAIPPTFIQSSLFRAFIVIAALVLVSVLYFMRVTQMTGRVRSRLEARLSERERIARELHDTLLQGFQGLLLRFQAAAEQIQPSSAARKPLEDALDLAEIVLSEGRGRVIDLRGGDQGDDMSELLVAAGKRALSQSMSGFSVVIEGTPRPVHPIVREEAIRIVDEALRNAAQHAQAEKIEISMTYQSRGLTLLVSDNGAGIDPKLLARGGRSNHFGLIGMRERAEKIQGNFTIASGIGAGTQITLFVPAYIAYSPNSTRGRGLFRRIHDFEA